MNYQDLKTEIETGPLASECAGKSDDEVAAILNDKRYQMVQERFVTARTVLAEIADGPAILDALEATAGSISAVKWAMRYMTGETGIDIGHPGTRAQLDALAGAGVLTVEQVAALKDMALQPASRAEVLGWPSVSYNDINAARAL